MPANFLLRGGRVVDPSQHLDQIADVRVRQGRVSEIGHLRPEPGEQIVDVESLVVAPGFIDVHVHLREPGQEWKETLGSGTAAAAAGGFTTVFCMPNTEPALDSVMMLEELSRRAVMDAVVRLHPIATISESRRGERPVDFEALARAGAVGFSDDGQSTPDSGVMVRALEASRDLNIPVMVHCEDPGLVGGAMHEGDVSRRLGIRGIPQEAEEIIIDRDLTLAALTGGWLHVCHVSTARGAAQIAAARRNGVKVTSEVMPHHLLMDDEWIDGNRTFVHSAREPEYPGVSGDANTKVNPPLRPGENAAALLAALKRAEIDLVATDHAPHAETEKRGRSFAESAFGLSGSEFALPLMLELVHAGLLDLKTVVATLSCTPARLWRLNRGSLRPGAEADITVFDPDEVWTPNPMDVISRGSNTPVLGMQLRGKVKSTYVGGDERHRDW